MSLAIPTYLVAQAYLKNDTLFGVMVTITGQKLNLMLFLNAILVMLIQMSNFLIYAFFGDIRIIEQKYIIEKAQKKVFQFLLLSIVLRNTFDVYKLLGLSFLFFFCVIHWLTNKRSDFLVSRGSRDLKDHLKMFVLGNLLAAICFVISFVFYKHFRIENNEEKMAKINVIIGFEVSKDC